MNDKTKKRLERFVQMYSLGAKVGVGIGVPFIVGTGVGKLAIGQPKWKQFFMAVGGMTLSDCIVTVLWNYINSQEGDWRRSIDSIDKALDQFFQNIMSDSKEDSGWPQS